MHIFVKCSGKQLCRTLTFISIKTKHKEGVIRLFHQALIINPLWWQAANYCWGSSLAQPWGGPDQMADCRWRSFSGDVMVMQLGEALDLSCVPLVRVMWRSYSKSSAQLLPAFRSVPLWNFQMLRSWDPAAAFQIESARCCNQVDKHCIRACPSFWCFVRKTEQIRQPWGFR